MTIKTFIASDANKLCIGIKHDGFLPEIVRIFLDKKEHDQYNLLGFQVDSVQRSGAACRPALATERVPDAAVKVRRCR
jgi:hypothetical protein